MSLWELGLLHRLGRLSLDRSPQAWARTALAADPRTVALPVTPEIALTASGLGEIRDPGNSIILATAIEHRAALVSRDERLRAHDPKRVIW